MIERIFLIVACHLMGDYLLQSNFLATTKGENWYHLFVHFFLYTIPFYIAFGWCWQLALIGILHFTSEGMTERWRKINYGKDQIEKNILEGSY